jgi:hypothetical protein
MWEFQFHVMRKYVAQGNPIIVQNVQRKMKTETFHVMSNAHHIFALIFPPPSYCAKFIYL